MNYHREPNPTCSAAHRRLHHRGVAWWYLAPTKIGGSTRYVVTAGSAWSRGSTPGTWHRPARGHLQGRGDRRLPQHAAPRVVLHRIIAIAATRYIFKGDNNNFIDPVHPTRSELLGKLWVHVPARWSLAQGFHTPASPRSSARCSECSSLLGVREKRRRRKRRREAQGILAARNTAREHLSRS